MAEKKYLDYDGLAEVVNKSKQSFQKKEFIGTAAEWALVPSADKAKYDVVNITDDNEGAPIATTSVAGIVKPDGTTIGVESDGTIKATVFTGTTSDWSQLSLAEKVKYSIVNLTDDYNQGNFQYSTVEQKTGRRWIDGKDIWTLVLVRNASDEDLSVNKVILGMNAETLVNLTVLHRRSNHNWRKDYFSTVNDFVIGFGGILEGSADPTLTGALYSRILLPEGQTPADRGVTQTVHIFEYTKTTD